MTKGKLLIRVLPSVSPTMLTSYGGLIEVRSSAIRAVGYDGNTLTIMFVSGRIYDHPRVPASVYESLMRASSKGEYYNHHIRGKYR
jgi:hypothetical protein